MHILITGATDFLGRNLRTHLENRTPSAGDRIIPISPADDPDQLAEAIDKADFVFHLMDAQQAAAHPSFLPDLLKGLAAAKKPPVLTAGATAEADESLRTYHQRTGAPVYSYHLAQVFGKWARPNQSSIVATLCTRLTRGLPLPVEFPEETVMLVYVDDVVDAFCRRMEEPSSGIHPACTVEPVYTIPVSELAQRLSSYGDMRNRLDVPDQSDPLTHKLYATYLSYLPPEDFSRTPVVHPDERGSFTELLHMDGYGQLSLNVSKPGIVKGEHWHRTKHEKFIVIQGEGMIRLRKLGDNTVISYRVSGETRTVVDIPPGYAHNIENLGDTDLYTLMWINERFDPSCTDAYPMPVVNPDANN
ncbi:MAG: SDR family oxidoreductase [Clostridiales bacterium]|nr:SDR family oxidoreductase [Clostridiales bacterium]